jgi:hypothetical protein
MAQTQLADRPSKTCPVCERPFQWRRKWARDWDRVRYCSKRCRTQAKRLRRPCQQHNPSIYA